MRAPITHTQASILSGEFGVSFFTEIAPFQRVSYRRALPTCRSVSG
jgi:hypothetical protein